MMHTRPCDKKAIGTLPTTKSTHLTNVPFSPHVFFFFLQNSALQWEHRVEELAAVTAGKPITSAMQPGERWFVVDARWMDHWLEFCTSKRRMAPPGPIDNSWMLHAERRCVCFVLS